MIKKKLLTLRTLKSFGRVLHLMPLKSCILGMVCLFINNIDRMDRERGTTITAILEMMIK
jgi:hypothetical protein